MVRMCYSPSQCPTCDERNNCTHPLNDEVRKNKPNNK